ncbi:MAG: putative membrane protein [Oceanicoccus sp.]|jgi:uncharacterized membrane protein
MNTIEFLRSFRIAEYAIFDFVAAFAGIYLLAPLLSKACRKLRLEVPKTNWLYLTLPLGILVHILVGNITPLTANFLAFNGHYILKLVMLILTILGFRGIKVIKKEPHS